MTAQTQTAHIVALYFQLTPEKYINKNVEGLKTPSGQRKTVIWLPDLWELRISAMH